MKKSFNIEKLLHYKSNHHGTKPMHPFLSIFFERHQEHDLKPLVEIGQNVTIIFATTFDY
jgi:hypothetical protein